MKISAFPKCYLDDIASGRLSLFAWIDMARSLGAEGLEMYERFFPSLAQSELERVREAAQSAGFEIPMMCCSPDFTQPNADGRKRAVEHEARLIWATATLGGTWCRVLSGQRYPEVPREQGVEWVLQAFGELFPVARAHGVILAMENHYKDGAWAYAEFAQKQDVFLEIVRSVAPTEPFGVQFDPSNAIVAGDDPIELLEAVKDRVVTMHASDRYLKAGASLDELRQADGTLGYSPNLCHGVVGKGLNDYDRIFAILARVRYQGWVSIEDGMSGMEEMRESIEFLKRKREQYMR